MTNKTLKYILYSCAALVIFGVILMTVPHRGQDYRAGSRALDTVNIGTVDDDGTGDPLKTAFIKINRILAIADSIGLDAVSSAEIDNLHNLIDSLNIHLDINDTASMLLPYSQLVEMRETIADSLEARAAAALTGVTLTRFQTLEQRTDNIGGLRAMGSTLIGLAVGATTMPTTDATLSDGIFFIQAIDIKKDTTITGITFDQVTQGVYTADNNNRLGIFSESSGTITLVASCANDGDLWKNAAGFVNKALSSPYSASAGNYYIGLLYNSSAQTTAPTIGKNTIITSPAALFTNNNGLCKYISAQTDLPASIALSTMTHSATTILWLGYY